MISRLHPEQGTAAVMPVADFEVAVSKVPDSEGRAAVHVEVGGDIANVELGLFPAIRTDRLKMEDKLV